MKFTNSFYLLLAAICLSCNPGKKETPATETPEKPSYEASWESLAKHNEEPDWFQDAKLGIYFHWGVYSVPAFGNEWYPRFMHVEGRREFDHHKEKYGHPATFGYHDFVPMFKAENFDPEAWADLFVKAGAKFAGPVAEHHDGFSMWDSEITPWNVADMGPKRDITGELKAAFDKRDIKLITTFHHARNLQRFDSIGDRKFWASHYPFIEDMPPGMGDSLQNYLYGNIPEEEWNEKIWLGKIVEVIDKYEPDIIWFDSWLDRIPEEYRQKMAAYYLNHAEKLNKEVVIVRKQDDLPLDFSVDDLEKSRKNRLEEKSWMTDETISKGSWCYTDNLQIKSAKDVLHVLIDITSKNGVLLLNISPTKEGDIPQDQQEVLIKMGEWLSTFGEAIYGTRPWYTFGEGPTKEPEGHFKNNKEFLKIKYSADDIRFTTKNDVIYAIILGWPEEDKITIESFASTALPSAITIEDVSVLGNDGKVNWELQESGLTVDLPSQPTDNMAPVIKIKVKN